MHRTIDPHDDYLGSGKILKQALKKYGKESFVKEILSLHDSYDEAYLVERNLVTEEFVSNKNTYNLKMGGQGSMGYKHSDEVKKKMGDIHRGKTLSPEHKEALISSIRGEKNPNYGSGTINEGMMQANRNRMKPVIGHGVRYESIEEALRMAGRGVGSKVTSKYETGWRYEDESLNTHKTGLPQIIGKKRKVSVEGVVYESVSLAARELKIPRSQVRHKLNSKNYPNWFKLSIDRF